MKIVVFGLGLIGGSLAATWSQAGYSVMGISPSESSRQTALNNAWVSHASKTVPIQWEPNTWLVLCGPLSINRQLLTELSASIMATSSVWVTDVGSCKRRIVALADQVIPGRFIGGHPLAGKSSGGIDNAEPSLFQNRPYVVCPNPHMPTEAQTLLETLVQKTGAHLKWMSADAHDYMMAWVSHFPQVYSVLLANQLQQQFQSPTPIEWDNFVYGPALSEHLRLASSSVQVWQDILLENADNLQAVLQSMRQMYQVAIETSDWSDLFLQANQAVSQMLKQPSEVP